MEIIKLLQSFSSSWLDNFFQLVTMMGEDYFFILVMAVLYWCVDKKMGYRLGFAYLSNGIINTALKEIFRIPRPIGADGIRSLRLETAGGYSFPSGHSQSAASIWTSLMIRIRKRWFYFLAVIMMVLVAISRLYLGVHRPVDVIFGLLIGTGWVFAANWLFDRAEKQQKPALLLYFFVPTLIGLFIFPTATYYKAAGTLTGFLLGYLLESRLIKFNPQAEPWQQVVKLFIGLSGLLAIKILVKQLLPLSNWSDFLRYALLGIWMTVIAPYLFAKLFTFTQPHTDSRSV